MNKPTSARRGLGDAGEELAARALRARGLVVVARKFRCRSGEIDLIARDGRMLVFVEVRKRTSAAFGGAAASITAAKRMRVIAAAQSYLATLPREPACRFDAVLIDGTPPPRIEWQRDVFSID